MDRDLVYVLLLVAVVATFLVLLAAVWNARRRPVGRPPETGVANAAVTTATRPDDPRTSAATAVSTPLDPVAATPTAEDPPPHVPAVLDRLVDPVTGLGGRQAWVEAMAKEEKRLARYRHPTTVLVCELHGLEALAERLGTDTADRLIPPVADALRRNARAADILARVDHARFFTLLPETDEIAAINFAERIRAACDVWLEAGAVAVRLVIGWASPPSGGTLADALALAQERMNADRPTRGTRPAGAPLSRPPIDRRSIGDVRSGSPSDTPDPSPMAAAGLITEGTGSSS